mmetsp:Transcript_15289/g.45480  ORF Transcript_15289/g.45480 Transcript_15289/m.45480 type:complete len:80 (+) Transcript_15289:1131-1370(+)
MQDLSRRSKANPRHTSHSPEGCCSQYGAIGYQLDAECMNCCTHPFHAQDRTHTGLWQVGADEHPLWCIKVASRKRMAAS